MPIEFEVTDLNSVEEEIRSAYVEKEGKHILDVDRYHEIKAAPLLKKNAELLNEKKKLAEATRTLEEKSKTGLNDVEKQIQERDQRIKELEHENREFAIWTPVRTLALKHGVMADRVDAVMTLLRANNRFDMENRDLVFKDKNGYPTTIKADRAFEVYLREELPWAFEASKAGGSGAQNSGRAPGLRTVDRATFDSWKDGQRDAFMADVAKGNARLID